MSAEPHPAPRRPRWHFSAAAGWINDPNGLVRIGDTWHLFFQHHPDGIAWGPMHWGHATSHDLLHWSPAPVALRPVGETMAFSGCALQDTAGRAGLGAGALVAIYTRHDAAARRAGRLDAEAQHLAHSLDGGRTWHDPADAPVMPNPGDRRDWRDPKVLRDDARDRWLMVLAEGDRIGFYASGDLRQWTFLSHFGPGLGAAEGVWECPDFFALPLAASGPAAPERWRWVLVVSVFRGGPAGGSAVQYFVGDFDGTRFVLDPAFAPAVQGGQAVWMDHGRDHYAFASWSGLPLGEVVGLAWMNNWLYAQKTPASTWRGAMTLPVRLALQQTDAGPRLTSTPAVELPRRASVALAPGPLPASLPLAGGGTVDARCFEFVVDIETPAGATWWVELANDEGEAYRIGFDGVAWFSDRSAAPVVPFDPQFAAGPARAPQPVSAAAGGLLSMRLLIDEHAAELWAEGGLVRLTEQFFPRWPFTRARLVTADGAAGAHLVQGAVHAL